MEKLNLGQIITGDQSRDAIHIAIAPVVAGHTFHPGDHIGFTGTDGETVGYEAKHIGIVDPFLDVWDVRKGQRFWMFLYPGTITSLKHEWTHPAFSDTRLPDRSSDYAESMAWIDKCAESLDVKSENLIAAATEYLKTGEDWYGEDRGGYTSFSGGEHLPDEFWTHYEIVTNTKVKDSDRVSFFSCSC